jgi:hypothetical protein
MTSLKLRELPTATERLKTSCTSSTKSVWRVSRQVGVRGSFSRSKEDIAPGVGRVMGGVLCKVSSVHHL